MRTVFLSSRIDELAIERRAAFEAVYSAGLVPILYETEPLEDVKNKIDALVDRADLFLGLYSHTIGESSTSLAELYPIEYELLRFLAAFDLGFRTSTSNSLHLAHNRRRLDRQMDDKGYHKRLTEKVRKACADKDGELWDVVRIRVRLYLKVAKGDWPVSSALRDFLEGLPRTPFATEVRNSPDIIPSELRVTSYVPPHGALFREILRDLEHGLHAPAGELRIGEEVNAPKVLLEVCGGDDPGVIHAALKESFEEWVNVCSIRIFEEPGGRFRTRFVGRPFTGANSQLDSPEAMAERLERSLRARLPAGHSVKAELQVAEPQGGENAVQPSPAFTYLLLEGANVPGLFMHVSALITSHGGSVRYVGFDSLGARARDPALGEERHPSSLIGVVPVLQRGSGPAGAESASALPDRSARAALVYQLKSLVGITMAKEVPHDEALRRHAELERGRTKAQDGASEVK